LRAQILELYAGSDTVREQRGRQTEEDTSAESNAVLLTVASLSGLIILISIYYSIAQKCKQGSKGNEDSDFDNIDWNRPNSGNRIQNLVQN